MSQKFTVCWSNPNPADTHIQQFKVFIKIFFSGTFNFNVAEMAPLLELQVKSRFCFFI